MTSPPARALCPVPTGNTFDKYGSRNPIVRRLMSGFNVAVSELLAAAAPSSILDVGCGEGVLTHDWARRLPATRVVGLDLPDPGLQKRWSEWPEANLEFRPGTAESLAFSEDEFDLVAAIESLEHVPDPGEVLAEMTRVARCHLLVSVPREPLWRALNLVRGAYVGRLGNTPGHLHHWSKRSLAELLEGYGEIAELRSPPPWTVALVRVG
jgi:2-polyprenyl-3-methyl-5-hydroxy-6-metoxy-1,4-benzoquinol methylase